MREIKYIIIHCAYTPWNMDIGVEEIRQWHIERGFLDCGYNYVVRLDGFVEEGRKECIPGAHTKGYNENSIGICYVGGKGPNGEWIDTRNDSQKKALTKLIKKLKDKYPNAMVIGHNDANKDKECPGFDAKKEYGNLDNDFIGIDPIGKEEILEELFSKMARVKIIITKDNIYIPWGWEGQMSTMDEARERIKGQHYNNDWEAPRLKLLDDLEKYKKSKYGK